MSRLLFAILLSAATTCHGAGSTLFSIDGIVLGSTFPVAKARSHCPVRTAPQPDKLCRETLDVAGQPVLRILEVRDHQLIGVSLSFPPAAYQALLDRYSSTLGEPQRRWQESIQTRDGHRVTNELARWATPDGDFVLQRYGSFASRGFAQIRLAGHPH